MPIRFLPEAESEMIEAAVYYQRQVAGLGDLFIREVEKAASWIALYPHASSAVRGKVRRKVLSSFPFSILYRAEEDSVLIIAVAHHKRRPSFWQQRK